MKRMILATIIAASALTATTAVARDDIKVTVTNLTNGIYFTPLLVAAHDRNTYLFELGKAASSHLQAMAEGGDISGLAADLASNNGTVVTNPANGLLAPGASTTGMLDIQDRHNRNLSVVAMMLPTNDGFIGLNAIAIPRHRGVYIFYLNGYDAGTEANDEIINGGGAPGVPGIPADPGGHGGTGATGAAMADSNTTVHIHPGNIGDMDPAGGFSDLDSRVHRWLNPVARVVLTVK